MCALICRFEYILMCKHVIPFVCVPACMSINICLYVYDMLLCMCIYIFIYLYMLCLYMIVCMCIYESACICICVSVYMCVCTYILLLYSLEMFSTQQHILSYNYVIPQRSKHFHPIGLQFVLDLLSMVIAILLCFYVQDCFRFQTYVRSGSVMFCLVYSPEHNTLQVHLCHMNSTSPIIYNPRIHSTDGLWRGESLALSTMG